MKRNLMVLAGVLLCGVLAFAGGNKDSGAGTGHYKFGFSATTGNNPFFHSIEAAVRAEVERRGDSLVVVDAQNDAQKQLSLVEDLIAQKIDVLLLCPVNSAGIKSALQACQRAGIPVVNFDTDVIDTDLVSSIIVSDNYNAGVLVARDMMSKLSRGSKVSLLTSPAAEACVKRVNGFKDTAAGYFTIVSELDGKGDTAISLPIAEDVLQSNPDLGAFYAINDPSALGCVQALRSQRRSGVLVYAVDGQPIGKKAIQEGTLEGTAAQSPINIGKKSIEIAYKLLDKQPVEKNIDVPVFMITKTNVAQYGVDDWQ
jgi:ribose transport system substrate-binding protein